MSINVMLFLSESQWVILFRELENNSKNLKVQHTILVKLKKYKFIKSSATFREDNLAISLKITKAFTL